MRTRVVVLGAGFGGLELTTILSDAFGNAVEIVLIDRNDSFVFGFSLLVEFALPFLKRIWVFSHAKSLCCCLFSGKGMLAPKHSDDYLPNVCPHLQTLRLAWDWVPHAGHFFCQLWRTGFLILGSAALAARRRTSLGSSAC